jgi:hypothetical protein
MPADRSLVVAGGSGRDKALSSYNVQVGAPTTRVDAVRRMEKGPEPTTVGFGAFLLVSG